MDITQLLIPHAGKLDGELQPPMAEADMLELSFGMVFAIHETQPDHEGALPLEMQGDSSSEFVDVMPDLVGQLEPEDGLLQEVEPVELDVLKRPDQMQAELPKAMMPLPFESDSSAQESTDAGWASDVHVPTQLRVEVTKLSQDPVQQVAMVDEAFDQPTSHADAPEVDRIAPSQRVEWHEPAVQGVPANQVPATNADTPNERPPKVSISQFTSEESGLIRGTEPRSSEQGGVPLARLDAVFPSPAEPVVEAQVKLAHPAMSASGQIKMLDSKPDGSFTGWGVEAQVITGRPTPDSPVASSKLSLPKIERPLMLTPASSAVEQLQNVPKTVEDLALTDPISITTEDAGQTAARFVESRSNGTEFVPVSTQAATYPVGTAPLMQMFEDDVERQPFDDAGFRIVEQVSATTGDLKTSALARPAEPPRIILAQIADVVRQQPDRPVELTLSPEELGRLRMSFQSEGSAMHVTLSFERPDTLDLMRRHINQLAQDLRAFGMSEVSFTFQQQTSDGGGGAFPNGGTAGPSNEQHSDSRAASDDVAPIVLNIMSGAGVDIRV